MISFYENHTPQEFGPKIPTEEEIISMIKGYGIFSSEAKDTFSIWYLNKQRECDESDNEYSQLKFNIDVANFCLKAGIIDEARKYCNQAWNFVTDVKFRENTITDDFLDMYRDLKELSDNIDKKSF